MSSRFQFAFAALIRWGYSSKGFSGNGCYPLPLLSRDKEVQEKPLFDYVYFKSADHRETGLMSLPLEILETICSHVEGEPQSTLAVLSRVSKTLQHVAERVLYSHIPELSEPRVIVFLKAIIRRPALGNHVRALVLFQTYPPSMDEREESAEGVFDLYGRLLMPSFYTLANRALSHMPRLKYLHLRLRGPKATAVLRGPCPYRLRRLTSMVTWDAVFREWLETQDSLVIAQFHGSHDGKTGLSPDSLPLLERVTGSLDMLKELVPGRPIRTVTLSTSGGDCLTQNEMESTMSVIKQSSVPVKAFHLMALLDGPPDQVLVALGAISVALPDLEELSINAIPGRIPLEVVTGIEDIVRRFTSLTVIEVGSNSPTDCLHGPDDTTGIDHALGLPEKWHAVCPNLELVILPKATWNLCKTYGWKTDGELKRLRKEELMVWYRKLLEQCAETDRVELRMREAQRTLLQFQVCLFGALFLLYLNVVFRVCRTRSL